MSLRPNKIAPLPVTSELGVFERMSCQVLGQHRPTQRKTVGRCAEGGAGLSPTAAYAPIGVIASGFILSDQGLQARAAAALAAKGEQRCFPNVNIVQNGT